MPLTCECPTNNDPGEYLVEEPDDYSVYDLPRGRRCRSCKTMIRRGDTCTAHPCFRYPISDTEADIVGGEDAQVTLAPRYLCEQCSDTYFSLRELGFCAMPDEDMDELLFYYQETYKPQPLHHNPEK